jgi:methyl-accepting chemotaxis protein
MRTATKPKTKRTAKGTASRRAPATRRRRHASGEMLDVVPASVVAIDRDYNITYANKMAAAALGKAQKECVGRKCYALFNTTHCNTPDCRATQAMQRDGVLTGDTVARLPCGDLPVRYTCTAIKDAKGTIVGAVEHIVDISKEQEITRGIRELVTAALDGRLAERAEVGNLEGNYREIVQGVNEMLDALLEPVQEAAGILQRMAQGDLTAQMTGDYRGDHAKTKESLNTTITSLRRILSNITCSVQDVVATSQQTSGSAQEAASAAEQILQASAEVSKAAQEAAKVAERAATTMCDVENGVATTAEASASVLALTEASAKVMESVEQAIRSVASASQEQAAAAEQADLVIKENVEAVDHVANQAQAAAQGAQSAADFARKGNEAGRQTAQGLGAIKGAVTQAGQQVLELNQRSQQIGRIIETIDDIAEQTNLLALNAAIEAARAGEHGKGFAVVADEVRKLAERSRHATGEIADLISAVQKGTQDVVVSMEEANMRIGQGEELVALTGKTLDDIQEGVREVNSELQSISASSQQLSAGMVEVGRASDRIAGLSQENAAVAQELQASSLELTHSIDTIEGSSRQASSASQGLRASSDDLNRAIADVASIGEETAANAEEATAAVEQQADAVQKVADAAQKLACLAQNVLEQLQQFNVGDANPAEDRFDASAQRKAAA